MYLGSQIQMVMEFRTVYCICVFIENGMTIDCGIFLLEIKQLLKCIKICIY